MGLEFYLLAFACLGNSIAIGFLASAIGKLRVAITNSGYPE